MTAPTEDLIERLEALISWHSRKATYWKRRENPKQAAVHYDAMTTLKQGLVAIAARSALTGSAQG